ncbi:DUF881 domain-containing protein [Candidatus Peregrinibacteria bacterium]|nr:DUF881 domain-containing protein [Candidatus Peregrinibacteria bacterium]
MRFRLVDIGFVAIGLAIGVILSLQIRAHPVKIGSSALDQFETKKAILTSLSVEQEELKQKLAAIEAKKEELKALIAGRSSKKTVQTLENLKELAGYSQVTGDGIRITLNDNVSVTRLDFSSINENFVQATDLRDLVNVLFLKDAKAISINGHRITPMTPIQSVFDSILVGSLQISPPFTVETIGNQTALTEAVKNLTKRNIQILTDPLPSIQIQPAQDSTTAKFLSLITE